jgi:formiminotetrahydrofolate cyclodeaminase
MQYRTQSLEKYLADASAGEPTPGGGSASAFAGALGAAMGCMAANFTVGRKKFERVWPRVSELLEQCERAREALLGLADADVAAYSHVSRAYAMPKETPDEKAARAAAIRDALKLAMQAPSKTFAVCAETIRAIDELADLANPNLLSDIGVAAALLLAALEGAQLNIEVNLACIKDEELTRATLADLNRSGAGARDTARRTLDKVYRRIRE